MGPAKVARVFQVKDFTFDIDGDQFFDSRTFRDGLDLGIAVTGNIIKGNYTQRKRFLF